MGESLTTTLQVLMSFGFAILCAMFVVGILIWLPAALRRVYRRQREARFRSMLRGFGFYSEAAIERAVEKRNRNGW